MFADLLRQQSVHWTIAAIHLLRLAADCDIDFSVLVHYLEYFWSSESVPVSQDRQDELQ